MCVYMYVLHVMHKIYNIIYILSSFSGEIRKLDSEIGEAEFLILRIYIWSAQKAKAIQH